MEGAASRIVSTSCKNILSLLACLGLTRKLVLSMLVVAAVPVMLVAFSALRAGADGIRRHTDLHLISVVSIIAEDVAYWIHPIEDIAVA